MKPYYQDEYVTIYHGDCREVIPDLVGIDLVLTDPQYGVGFKYANDDDDASIILPMNLEVLSMCRKIAERVVLTPGIKHLFAYPKPDHVGSFFYPAGCGVSAWGFICWQPILFYGRDPFAGNKGSRPDSWKSKEASPKNGHPCPKPQTQWNWLLARVSKPTDLILDPFAGSGTTGRAAKDLGRKCVLIEREEMYCEIAARGMGQETLQLKP